MVNLPTLWHIEATAQEGSPTLSHQFPPRKELRKHPQRKGEAPMAKVSVSIPDDLKEQLDDYAENTGFNRSTAVSHILKTFFNSEAQIPDPIDPDLITQLSERLNEISDYIGALHESDPERYTRPVWMPQPKSRSQLGRALKMLEDSDGW